MTPFSAALSSVLIALRTDSFVSSAPSANAARAWLTAVRAEPRTLRLFRRRFSFCRFRLICDLILAKVFLRKISCRRSHTSGTFLEWRRCILHEATGFVQQFPTTGSIQFARELYPLN